MATLNTDLRNKKIDTINELIQVTRDSAEFYTDAAKEVKNPNLRSLFEQIADSKNGLVGAMSRQVRDEGAKPATAGTFSGSLRQFYGTVKAKMKTDKGDYAFVSELEDSEDRLLDAFHDVLKSDSAPQEVKQTLMGYMPTVQGHHDAMRNRKWEMQARQ